MQDNIKLYFRGTSGREVFPITGESEHAIENYIKPVNDSKKTRLLLKRDDLNRFYDISGISPCLNTMQGGGREPKIAIPVLTPDRAKKRQNGRRFKENGDEMFTLTAQDRHGILVKEATKKGYTVAEVCDSVNISHPNSKTRRGRVGKQVANTILTGEEQAVIVQKGRGFNKGGEHDVAPTLSSNSWHENNLLKVIGSTQNNAAITDGTISPTLTSSTGTGGGHVPMPVFRDLRIRKLTPRECWRLQGFPDLAFDKAQEVNSNSQLYKQVGNSVTVNVIAEIAKKFEDVLN